MSRNINQVIKVLPFLALPALLWANDSGRIYGKVYTHDREVYEGLIRWDKNEVSWVDVLNGQKELPSKNRREAQRYGSERSNRGHSVSIFGLKINGGEEIGSLTMPSQEFVLGILRPSKLSTTTEFF